MGGESGAETPMQPVGTGTAPQAFAECRTGLGAKTWSKPVKTHTDHRGFEWKGWEEETPLGGSE